MYNIYTLVYYVNLLRNSKYSHVSINLQSLLFVCVLDAGDPILQREGGRDREESLLTRSSLITVSAKKAKMASRSQDMHDQQVY
jgi:hypothetical protein